MQHVKPTHQGGGETRDRSDKEGRILPRGRRRHPCFATVDDTRRQSPCRGLLATARAREESPSRALGRRPRREPAALRGSSLAVRVCAMSSTSQSSRPAERAGASAAACAGEQPRPGPCRPPKPAPPTERLPMPELPPAPAPAPPLSGERSASSRASTSSASSRSTRACTDGIAPGAIGGVNGRAAPCRRRRRRARDRATRRHSVAARARSRASPVRGQETHAGVRGGAPGRGV